eukprot:15451767-Alexandrium_andersonii.AAC.1
MTAADETLKDTCLRDLGGRCAVSFCQKRHLIAAEKRVVLHRLRYMDCNDGLQCATVNCVYSHPPGHEAIGEAAKG